MKLYIWFYRIWGGIVVLCIYVVYCDVWFEIFIVCFVFCDFLNIDIDMDIMVVDIIYYDFFEVVVDVIEIEIKKVYKKKVM